MIQLQLGYNYISLGKFYFNIVMNKGCKKGNGAILRGSNGFSFSPNQQHLKFYHNTNSPHTDS